MDLTVEIAGVSLGSPSPALVAFALAFAILAFAFAEHLAERRDDPRILIGTLGAMATSVWLVDVVPADGRTTFAAFVIETAIGCGAFGLLAAIGVAVSSARRGSITRVSGLVRLVFVWCAATLVTMVRRAWPKLVPN